MDTSVTNSARTMYYTNSVVAASQPNRKSTSKLPTEFIERFADMKRVSSFTRDSKDMSIARQSHMFLNGRKIAEIVGIRLDELKHTLGRVQIRHLSVVPLPQGDLTICAGNLKVLYLQHNAIRRIQNVSGLRTLTHLYLQRNRIGRIEGLDGLFNLQKLYLGMNDIKRLENLETLENLTELHVERQRWATAASPDSDEVELTVCNNSLEALSGHLKVLNVTGLQLKSLTPFHKLYRLEVLNAGENLFDCSKQLGLDLAAFTYLHSADFAGCAAHGELYFKENVLESAPQIVVLDGHIIPKSTRHFIRDFALVRAQRLVNRSKASYAEVDAMKRKSSSKSRRRRSLRLEGATISMDDEIERVMNDSHLE